MGKRKININKAIQQKVEKGMSYQEIADNQGVSKPAIWYAIKDLIPSEQDMKDIQLYRSIEADLFAGLRSRILYKLNDETLERMLSKHAGAAVMLLNSAFNNERLLRGESTSNVAEFHKAIQVLKHMDDEPDQCTASELVIDAEVVK